MSNNLKVAAAIVEMAAEGTLLTAASVAERSGVHIVASGNFLRYWHVVGWLTKQRRGLEMIFSLTEAGTTGFTKLIKSST